MEHLSPSALRALAPAAQKLPKSDDALVDTQAILKNLAQDGYRPVFAVQGKPHADSDKPEMGRHFVVAADGHGHCYAILNSHSVYRRAWLATGHWYRDDPEEPPCLILFAAVPLRRWRGFETPLGELKALKTPVQKIYAQLDDWVPEKHQNRWIAKQISLRGYMPGYKPADREVFIPVDGTAAADTLDQAFYEMMRGGLPPDRKGRIKGDRTSYQRRVKPLKGPDAIMWAANALGIVGRAALRKYKVEGYSHAEFPEFKQT